jgi:hypothetical protein
MVRHLRKIRHRPKAIALRGLGIPLVNQPKLEYKRFERHSPERPALNATENVWQFLPDNWLSNRVFKSCGDIVDHCYRAWNKLADQPWRIMSTGPTTRPAGADQGVLV